MLVRGQLTCYHCGGVAGTAIVEGAGQGAILAYWPAEEGTVRAAPRHCPRCRGPLYLDDASLLSLRRDELPASPLGWRLAGGERPGAATLGR
jgi:hypothetical protein